MVVLLGAGASLFFFKCVGFKISQLGELTSVVKRSSSMFRGQKGVVLQGQNRPYLVLLHYVYVPG
jgi:hypothetical protein